MIRRVLMALLILSWTVTACAPAEATTAAPASPTIPPTATLPPTQTPSPTPSPTGTATLSPTETFTPEPSSTFTPAPYLPPSATRKPVKQKPPDGPTPTDTATLTLEPPASDTATLTPPPTFCPLPTPEVLRVQPVTSPTDQLSQVITVHVGYGTEVTISAESGTFTVTGSFGAFANPALVDVTLLPNTVHHLDVTAKIQPPPYGGCIYGSYTLHTTLDQNGVPLVIVQGNAVP